MNFVDDESVETSREEVQLWVWVYGVLNCDLMDYLDPCSIQFT